MKNIAFLILPGILLGVLGLVGCGSPVRRFDVTGTVTIAGKPAPQGLQVVFSPRDSSLADAAIGVTNDRGVYVMYASPGKKGLPPGDYVVAVTTSGDGLPGPNLGPPELARIKVPDQYQQGASELRCTVGRSTTTFDIRIETP
jgi:hypothetical protein